MGPVFFLVFLQGTSVYKAGVHAHDTLYPGYSIFTSTRAYTG